MQIPLQRYRALLVGYLRRQQGRFALLSAFLLASIQIGLVLIGVSGSFYVTFIGIMLVVVVIANVRLGRFGGSQA